MLAARPETRGTHTSLEAYHQRWKAGEFGDTRVELLDGEVVEMSPMGPPHVDAMRELTLHLVLALRACHPELAVCVQTPVKTRDQWEPVPDFSITTRLPRPTDGAPPTADAEVKLLIEVSDSTLRTDLGPKAAQYAKSDFREYWVIDLGAKEVVVHRQPDGARYTSVSRWPWTSRVESSAVPGLEVVLSEVLW